jgi:hypothetical protein
MRGNLMDTLPPRRVTYGSKPGFVSDEHDRMPAIYAQVPKSTCSSGSDAVRWR